jgi:nicotinamidase-related amidase
MSLIDHAASNSYSQSGFSNRMGWGSRPALILVDVCKAYFTEGSPLSLLSNPAGASSPDSMRRLLAAARAGQVPVIWSQIEYLRPDMADAGLFWRKAKLLDVWLKGDDRGLADGLDGLEIQQGDVVVVKKYPSAFFGTPLASELQVNHPQPQRVKRTAQS